MLYENEEVELPRKYDPETGNDVLSDLRGKDAYEEAIEAGEKMASLKSHAGWQVLEKELQATISRYSEILFEELDPGKIRRIQEAAKAYRSVLMFVTDKIQEAEFARRQLDQLDTFSKKG
jgi:hypothetical protein